MLIFNLHKMISRMLNAVPKSAIPVFHISENLSRALYGHSDRFYSRFGDVDLHSLRNNHSQTAACSESSTGIHLDFSGMEQVKKRVAGDTAHGKYDIEMGDKVSRTS